LTGKHIKFVKPDLVLDKLIALTSYASQRMRESLADCICKVATHIDSNMYFPKALKGICFSNEGCSYGGQGMNFE
jgi:hypothetical protein